MHWTERRRAKANLALGLRSRGWTLYGFHEDASDSMTDYYSPASWDGVAEKDGYVVVVSIGRGSSILKRSGGYETTTQAPVGDCPRCGGSGQEPDGWAYEQAKASPREFNLDAVRREGHGGVPVMPDVVSPLHFDPSGRQKCVQCRGNGRAWTTTTVRKEWPTYTVNPDNKMWHVEQAGHILASGVGLGPCADHDRERSRAAVQQIVDRIERAIAGHGRQPAATPAAAPRSNGIVIARNLERSGIEVTFPAKPDEAIRDGLKRLGFRWSGRQGLWYARHSASLWDRVHQFLQVGEASDVAPLNPGPAMRNEPAVETGLTTNAETNPAIPSPDSPPWTMTQYTFRLSRARYAGGVPILNADDRHVHEKAVRRAAASGRPVPPCVLAEYGLENAGQGPAPQPAAEDLNSPQAISIDVHGITWYAGENSVPQTFWWHRDTQGRLWQAILTSGTMAWWGSVETKEGICSLTTASEFATHREEDVLYGQADPSGVNPPLRLLAAMSRLILSGDDPTAMPRQKVSSQREAESLETRDPAAMTSAEILVEALRLDTVIRTADHGFPAEIAERMEALRAAMYRLDPSVALDAALREMRTYDVPKLVRDWKELTRRLERGHDLRSNTRAAATTKSAHLGKLAQSRDQVLDALRIVVRQAQERGETIPFAIRADPELACILAGELDPQMPPPCDPLDVDGTIWRLEPTPDGRPVWAAEDKGRRRWSVTHFRGSGTLTGKSWWTVQTEVDGRPVPLNTQVEGAGEGPLYALTDDEEPPPPTGLLQATSELIRLDYPNDVTLDDVAWTCTLQGDGHIRYEARRDPWWYFYMEGRPGHWEAHWHKPGAPGGRGTHRCLTEEEHGELQGEKDPLVILATLTGYVRHRGGPPPRVEVRCAEIAPREDGGWDWASLDGGDPPEQASAVLAEPEIVLAVASPTQLSLFAL